MAERGRFVTLSPGDEGIHRLTIAVADENALGEMLDDLDLALDRVEEAGDEIRALLVHGTTPGPVLPPWRVADRAENRDAEAAAGEALTGQGVLRRLERLAMPTVAVIDGACLGNGLELALACAFRVAADSPRTQLGLPQVRAGLIPGLGATVRLPRLIGVQAALEMILSGRPVGARRARSLGLVDEVLAARDPLEGARTFLASRLARKGGTIGVRRRGAVRLLEGTGPGRRLLVGRVTRRLLPAVSFAGPAPESALERVMAGVSLPLEEAFRAEAAAFGELVAGERAGALAHASAVVRAAGRSGAVGAPVEQAAVLGAGGLGGDLAYLIAAADLPVRLKDARRPVLEEGLRRARRRLAEEIRGGRITEGDADRRDGLLSGGSGWGGFGTVDLVIVAAEGSDAEVAEVLRQAEEHTREECVLAFVATRARAAAVQAEVGRGARVVALYPIAPVDRFPLLEIAPGPGTDAETVATCRRFARRLGHTPLVVADRAGGVSNRLLAAWLAEATRLVEEGAGVEQVDRVAADFGFVLGPFRRMDAIGAARAAALLQTLGEELGDRFLAAAPLVRVAARGEEFYRYRGGAAAGPNPTLPAGFRAEDAGLAAVIRDRLVLTLVNEAARILDEGVAASAAAVDVASLLGLGFPRALGGLLYHADRLVPETVADELHDLAARFGERFIPVPLPFSGHASGRVL